VSGDRGRPRSNFVATRLGQTEDRAQQPGDPGDVGVMRRSWVRFPPPAQFTSADDEGGRLDATINLWLGNLR